MQERHTKKQLSIVGGRGNKQGQMRDGGADDSVCGFSSSEIGFSTNETDERSSITATKLEQMKTIQYNIIQ
jgi:hypothetical protein